MPDEISGAFDPSQHGVPKAHYVHTRENGRLASTTTADLDGILDGLNQEQRIVLHFHGGLVPEQNGTAAAASLLRVYRDAGAYPIFFIWRSGLMNVLVDNLSEIAGEGMFKQLERLVTKFVVGKIERRDGSRSIAASVPDEVDVRKELSRKNRGEEPYGELTIPDELTLLDPEEIEAFNQDVLDNPDFQAEVSAVVREYSSETVEASRGGVPVREVQSDHSLMSSEVVNEIKAEYDDPSKAVGTITMARLAVKVLKRVIERLVAKRDHGLYPTVAEEILRVFYLANAGERIWTVMKAETSQTFEESTEVRGGRYFMDGLTRLMKDGWRPEITLVGHSTGAVFINNFLNDLRKRFTDGSGNIPPDFRIKNVIFLAPACTYRDFQEVAVEHEQPFERFRMFTMDDKHESEDRLVSVLYPRSLLYLISGILEKDASGGSAFDEPVVGMNRYFVRSDVYQMPEVEGVRAFIQGQPDRAVWSPTQGGPGLSSRAISHSSFDEDHSVRESMKVIIRGG